MILFESETLRTIFLLEIEILQTFHYTFAFSVQFIIYSVDYAEHFVKTISSDTVKFFYVLLID